MTKELKTLEDKIDLLLKGREKERILSRLDGAFNLLITLSAFIVGVFISQRDFIVTNVSISFPLIAVVFSMVIAFILNFKGMITKESQSMKYRMIAYCLLLTLPMWYTTIPVLVFISVNLTTLEMTCIVLIVLTVVLSAFFIQCFEKKFPSLFEQQETIILWKIIFWILLTVLLIVPLAIIATDVIFLAWGLPILLK